SLYFFSSRRRHTRCYRDWSSDVCSSDLENFRHVPDSRSGLIMGDFHRWASREGRRVWQGALNVGFSAFHEGWGAGKTDPRGGHRSEERRVGKGGRTRGASESAAENSATQ